MTLRKAKASAINELQYKYCMLIRKLNNRVLIMQPQVYITSNIRNEYIEIQITWKSVTKETFQNYTKFISVTEDFNESLRKVCKMCEIIVNDAEPLGEASYWEILRDL